MTKNILFLFVLVAFCVSLFSCSKNGAIQQPSILSFYPASGSAGTTVTITGTNLEPAKVTSTVGIVNFNGAAAVVTSLTSTRIITKVPAGASTGTISVSVNGVTCRSSSSFTIF
jgi:hypothetical protein